MMSKYCTHFT